MPASRDYYSILQINPGVNADAIDAAYERLSKIYDPETSKKAKAAERMAEVEEAYEILGDPRRRSDYDKMRSRGYLPGSEGSTSAHPSGVRGIGSRIWAWLDNPYVFAGIAAMGVVVILVAIVLISVVGDDDDDLTVLQPSPSATVAAPTATLPAQTPGTPPSSPPPVEGDAVSTGTGLQYIDIVPGTGGSPSNGDRVAVNYTGWLQSDGTMFDSSVDNPEPFAFVLGTGSVIPGWDEGVLTMQKGGQRRLIIPPDLAYGPSGQGSIPPNATLVFDITMIEIFPSATPAPAPTTSPAGEASPSP